jgi:hypothetical protein
MMKLVSRRQAQARDHADINGVAFGDRGQRFARGTALDGLQALVIGKLGLLARRHGTFAASPVRSRISSCSNSAMAADSVDSSRPWLEVVSKRGSPSERKAAPTWPMRSIRSSSSRVLRPIGAGSADFLLEVLPDTCSLEGFQLAGQILAFDADPGLSRNSHL